MILLLTGNGKGKTTSAIGAATRALGNNMSVRWVSFMKGQPSGEHAFFKYFNAPFCGDFSHKITGLDSFSVNIDDNAEEIRKGLKFLSESTSDIVVLDEFVHLLTFKLITKEFAQELIKHLESTREHIIITGSNAPQWLIDKADLVSEVKYIKHYFDSVKKPIRGLEF